MKMLCPKCNREIDDIVRFCPNCGTQIDLEGSVISTGKKVKIYLVSFFLTPLGLIWFFKYIKSSESESVKVAYTSLIITLIPLIYMIIIVSKYTSVFTGDFGIFKSTIDVYSELGF